MRKSILAASLGLVAALAGCSSDNGNNTGDEYPIDCAGCRTEGQSCTYSINCPAGAICNDPVDDLYDSSKPDLTCVKVVCASDADCEAPKTCSLEKICNPPVCQTNDECEGGQTCQAGSCKPAPNAADVASCEVATRSGAIRQGQTMELTAVARNANGAVLPGVGFDWSSSNDGAVSVAGSVATGGATAGSATLTAAVTGKASVTCSGLSLVNFPTVGANQVRVVLVADGDGAPITGAEVTLDAGGALTATTDATGSALFDTAAAVASVTIVKAGFQSVSIISPATNDIFVPVPKVPDETKAGGFRGSVDISTTKKADIQLGIAGPALPQNLLDFDLTSLIGDSVTTVIDAPELGLNMQSVDLPGGVMLGLGNKKFTADGTGLRCQGTAPSANELGCYVARAPAGKGAAWVLAGQLKLSQVTSIANQLSGALGGGTEDLPIGDLLTALLPLLRTLNHGVNASLDVAEFPKVPVDAASGVDCSVEENGNDDSKCRGDFSKYGRISLAADAKLGVLSSVTVPQLPTLPGSSDCAGATVLLTGAILPGRGIVPLGLSAGVDSLDDRDTADCKISGVKDPFGPNSGELGDNQMPLSMAPPHGGIEGSELAMIALTIDPDVFSGNSVQFNAVVKHTNAVAANETISEPYLPFPQGTLSRSNATFTFQSAVTGATVVRLEIQSGDETWLVWAPGTSTTITLPNVAGARGVLSGTGDAYIQAMKIDGDYKSMWEFGSGKTLDNLVSQVRAFVVQGCTAAAGPCIDN
ncbi:hypothetical protein L6R52_31805 [Myxococcota bacterium]|nr:hypothetical protein [Myxococcota bacterium]